MCCLSGCSLEATFSGCHHDDPGSNPGRHAPTLHGVLPYVAINDYCNEPARYQHPLFCIKLSEEENDLFRDFQSNEVFSI
jgi:hypothetical protein